MWVRRLLALPNLVRAWLELARLPTWPGDREAGTDDPPTIVLEPVADQPTDQHWRLDELVGSVADTQPIPAVEEQARREARAALRHAGRPSLEVLEQVLVELRKL